jgi:hypothetical protein
MIKTEEATGLFSADGTFRTRSQIIDDLKRREQLVIHHTPVCPDRKDFAWWSMVMERRQKERQETMAFPSHVNIEIPAKDPITLVFFGDVHAGSEEVDYRRLNQDIAYVRDRPNTYAMVLGDLIDGYFWGGEAQGADIANFCEQDMFIKEALGELKGKLLVAWKGDHDGWAEKTGITMYQQFQREFNAHYMEGVGYVSLQVGDQLYRISAAHRHNGFSVYNHAHAALRLHLDDAEGADIFVTAHNHKKAIDVQSIKEFGGTAREAYFLSLGTYKRSDSYSRKKGFSQLAPEQMGCTSLILDPKERQIVPVWTLGSRIAITN